MAVQVSQSTYNVIQGQRDSYQNALPQYEAQRDNAISSLEDLHELIDDLDVVLADLEVTT